MCMSPGEWGRDQQARDGHHTGEPGAHSQLPLAEDI